MPQEEMTARFRTALMGFQKQDVLNWIDERTAEAQKRQEEAKAREAELQQQLAALQEEKQALDAQLADAKARVQQMHEQLEDCKARQEKAEAEAQSYKVRLFDKEQEVVRLRGESSEMRRQLDELAAQLGTKELSIRFPF